MGRGPLLAAAAAGAVTALTVVAGGLAIAERAGLATELVRTALRDHPEILTETAERLRDQQHAPTIAANRTALMTPFGSSWKGSASPDVVLVEFYDYACTYCRASLADVERLLAEDKRLRVVFRELPILGPASVEASRLALAASQAGRFNRFHDALFAAGRPSPETLQKAARAAGIATVAPAQPEFEAEIRRNFELAGSLGATGTPLFVVGDRLFNGAVGYGVLKQAIADARRDL